MLAYWLISFAVALAVGVFWLGRRQRRAKEMAELGRMLDTAHREAKDLLAMTRKLQGH